VDLIAEFGLYIRDTIGWNFSVLHDSFDRRQFLGGIVTTVELAAACVVLSVVVGATGALLQGAPSRIVRGITQGYVQFFRNTPPLVQLYFFYFGIGPLLPEVTNEWGVRQPMLGSFGWAMVSLSLFAGAYNVEIFRSGIEAVPRAMVESAEALGYTRLQIFRYVLLPLGFRICLPALNNNLVNLMKTTSQAFAIAVPEILYVAVQIYTDRLNVREMMVVMLVTYVSLVAFLVWSMGRWERRLRIPGYSQ
jgi:polar amino acid transport system permease protein